MDNLTITVSLKELDELVKKYPEAAKKATVGRLTEALLMLEAEIQEETPVGAGPIHLRDTIFHKIELGETLWGFVGTPAQYGLPVEMGTKPHFPPVAPIQHWVEKILGLEGKEAKSVAYLIARKISKKGTYGTYMFHYSVERNRAKVETILGKIPADIVKSLEGGQ